MTNNKSIAKRLMVLYISFIVVIALSIINNLSDFKDGFEMGYKIADMQYDPASGHKNVFYLNSIKLEKDQNIIPLTNNESQFNITAYGDAISLFVEENPDKEQPPFKIVSEHPLFKIAILAMGIALVWIMVLIARIILSVRRSIIEEKGIDKSNLRRVRWIGAILICSEFLIALASWQTNIQAAKLLEGSGLNVDTSYSPDYWIIMLGVLILFMGELFAITHSLSEEQKLTI
ncbi:MAG: DUF2975 domain-containing protein [Rikenellaceae bacterium]